MARTVVDDDGVGREQIPISQEIGIDRRMPDLHMVSLA